MIKAGTKCRVLADDANNFNPGDIVVVLQEDDVRYCCLLEDFYFNRIIGEYNSNGMYDLGDYELEVLDDDWTEK